MKLIILTGMPASGKSTIAARLGNEFKLPILEKDYLKEALFDTLGFENYPQKRKLDHAANAVLLRSTEALMKQQVPMIIDNNFDTASGEQLNKLVTDYNCDCLTIFLGGDTDAFYQRYVKRDQLHLRHLGHILQDHYPPKEGDCLDYTMTRDEFSEKFEKRGMTSFNCRGERIEIDATWPEKVDVDGLVEQIRAFLEK